ncbi:MAG: cell division protein FtsQ/DivIB [Candidatus Cryptobacteroides sp.]
MKKGLKNVIVCAAVLLLGVLCLLIWRMNGEKQRLKTCSGLRVEYEDDYIFVSPEDVENYLKSDYGPIVGQRLDSVDLRRIEDILDLKSAVLKAEAFTTPDGFLNVKMRQREPAVRFQKGRTGFYADERGFIFPLQSNYTARVPIIDGNIPLNIPENFKGEPADGKEKEWLASAIRLVNFIKGSKVWSENISQMSINAGGDIVMVLREGKEKFIFGGPDNPEAKFARIEKYYSTIVPAKGKDTYSTVNVKYDGQIVCRK